MALLSDHVAQPAKRRVVIDATEQALAALKPLRPSLRVQAVHGDMTDDNVVLSPEGNGVIDFGDLAQAWLAAELAATGASALHHLANNPLGVLDVIDSLHAESPLDDNDIAALWPLIVSRGAVLVVSGEHQVLLDENNTYADENRAHEWVAFDRARRIPAREIETVIRARLAGVSQPNGVDTLSLGRWIATDSVNENVIDLSVTSHALDDGRWLLPGSEDRILQLASQAYGHSHAIRRSPARSSHNRSLSTIHDPGIERHD